MITFLNKFTFSTFQLIDPIIRAIAHPTAQIRELIMQVESVLEDKVFDCLRFLSFLVIAIQKLNNS